MFIISGTLGGTRFIDDDIWLRFVGLFIQDLVLIHLLTTKSKQNSEC